MQEINNDFYDKLGNDWINRADHPIAIHRTRNKTLSPWICDEIRRQIGSEAKVLDIGCGAGFLTNDLAKAGFDSVGVDLSSESLIVAKTSDSTKDVTYIHANAYSLPFPNHSFDVVCAIDILEHVEVPNLLVAEAARVLKSGGLLFFHTVNRNFLSYLLFVQGAKWLVPNTPKNMHLYSLFIRPHELQEILELYKMKPIIWRGFSPKLLSLQMLKMLFTRRVPRKFPFRFSKILSTGYCGIAIKQTKY